MRFYYVYMVICNDHSIYTGITNNLERRLYEHNFAINDNSYTANRRPVILIFYQEFMQFEQAVKFEKQIKKWSRAKKLALAKGNFEKLRLLSQCQNESHYKNEHKKRSDHPKR